MKNFWRVAVVVASLLATFIGAKYAKEVAQPGGAQANIEKVKTAEWVKVEGNEYVTGYAAPATIHKIDNKVKMLALVDFKTANSSGGYPHMSTKAQHEYDCKGNQWRLLYFSYHSENMGAGELIYTDAEPGKWEPVMIGSGTQIRWKIACGNQ
jgi:hypothetical protein